MRRFLALFLIVGVLSGPGFAAPVLDDAFTQQAAQEQQFFDGAAPHGRLASAPAVDGSTRAYAARGELAPQTEAARPAAPVPAPQAARDSRGAVKLHGWEKLEDRLFTISWWMYHVSWAADTFMTGWGISHGMGFESDHLYTLFGNRNVAGVVGSLTAGHVLVSGLTLMMHRKAKKHHGWARTLLETAAIGINLAGVVAHATGVASWVPLF